MRQARELLMQWAGEQAAVTRRRPEVIRTAYTSGISKSEISRLTGIARTTINRIVTSGPDGSDTAQAAEQTS